MVSKQHKLEYFGYRVIEKLVCSLPDTSLAAFARPLAFFIFFILGIRKRVSLENLAIAFPECSLSWRKKVAYFSYLHFSVMILEFMKMQKWSQQKVRSKFRLAEMDKLLPVLKNGNGAIVVSGHFGNWEVAMRYLFTHRLRSTAIQQNQQNELINHRMRTLRQRWGIQIVDTRGAVKNCEIALTHGRIIAILGDQDAGHRGVFVPFFSRPAATHVGATVLYLKTGVPLFLGTCCRSSQQQFEFRFQRIDNSVINFSPEENIKQITAELMRQLETAIKKHPEQYFWMHKRWKTTPK